LFFIPALLRRAKKRGKNPHSEAVKKGAKKIHLRQRRKKEKGQKIQVASPHQFILFDMVGFLWTSAYIQI